METCCPEKCRSPCGKRSFFTKKERVDMLKDYRDQLENESKAVEEKMQELGEG
tara:strand:- start:326 stop:484 length:159 start_codon:yes stop_codon:yes gene_type:complete